MSNRPMNWQSQRYSMLHPLGMLQTLVEITRFVRRNRSLILTLVRREITERYAGQVLGALWAIGHPLFLVLVYVFIFGVVFQARVDIPDVPNNYTVYIISGLLPWMSLIESLSKSSVVISSNHALVKQVVFPLETLVIRTVITAIVPQLVGTAFLVGYMLLVIGVLPTTLLLLPLLLLFQIMLMTGIGFILSAVGTYFRDIKDLVQLFAIAGLYAMPVVYLPGWAPSPFDKLLWLNPFSYMVWTFQDAVFFGRFEHPLAWLVFGLMSLSVLVIGFRLFRRLKVYFADIL